MIPIAELYTSILVFKLAEVWSDVAKVLSAGQQKYPKGAEFPMIYFSEQLYLSQDLQEKQYNFLSLNLYDNLYVYHLLLGIYWHILCLPYLRKVYNQRWWCEEHILMIRVIHPTDVATWIRRKHRTVECCYMLINIHLLSRTAAATMMRIVKRSPMTRQQTSVHFLSLSW